MARIAELARRYGFRVIEDASHAIGARYGGRPVGCCEHADITVFSFHPVKIITTGRAACSPPTTPGWPSACAGCAAMASPETRRR